MKLKLGIDLPAYGGTVSAEHAKMWLDVGMTLSESSQRFQLNLFGFQDVCGVDRARNQAVTAAVTAGCDWLLMIDADTWVDDGRDLLVMISEADRADAAVVVAPVRRRRIGEGDSELVIYKKVNTVLHTIEIEKVNQMFEVDAAGTACMAVRLSSVKELGENPFVFTETESEDLSFCRRIKMQGGTILCDPRVKTYHKARTAVLASR